MRRPLNWIVVSLSLLALFANRVFLESAVPQSRLAAISGSSPAPEAAIPSPFAYVNEDGSQVYLPVVRRAAGPVQYPEDLHAASGFDQWARVERPQAGAHELEAAVYTWSAPAGGAQSIYP
jgi:hypothetical protein